MTAWTPEEMTRALARIEGAVSELGKTVQSLDFVRKDIYERDRAAADAEIAALKDQLRWARRTVLGAFIAFLVPAMCTLLLIRGGG